MDTPEVPGSKEEPYQVVYDYYYDEVFSKKTDLTSANASAALKSAYEAGTVNTNLYAYYNQTGTAPYCMYYSTEEGAFLMARIDDTAKPYPWMAYEVAELYAGSYKVDLEYKAYVNATRALEVYMIPASKVTGADTSAVADADGNGAVDTVDVIEALLNYTDSKGVNP